MKKKHFCDMSLIEIVECLVKQKHNGEKIDLPTAQYSLSRVLPMLEHQLKGDIAVLEELIEKKQDYKDWKKDCDHLQALVNKGKKILTQH